MQKNFICLHSEHFIEVRVDVIGVGDTTPNTAFVLTRVEAAAAAAAAVAARCLFAR
jgi:hypothetical protein